MKKKSEAWGGLYPYAKKMMLIMRLTIFLVLVSVMASTASVYSQTTKLTVKMNNRKIADVFDAIEQQSDFYFFYNRDLFDDGQIVSVDMEGKTVEEILDEVLEGKSVTYEVVNSDILIKTVEERASNDSKAQQEKSVSGKISDKSGEPLPGVTVVVKGTTNGTITDFDGNYTITNVPDGATLQFSFVGMRLQEVAVGSQSVINITMEEETIGLEEVVAVGYGVQKKSSITGAIASVDAEEMQNRSTNNAGQAMQGKVSGVQIMNMSSAPGADPTFRVRGYSSNGANSDPLYIVDGLKVTSISYLDPSSIESIEVLKDAASAAIYGAEAGNGVVLVTTREGSKGKSRFFLNSLYASQKPRTKLDFMTGEQFTSYWQEAGYPASSFQGADTDWQDVMFETGQRMTHTIGFEGGSEKGTFYAALTYNGEDGMIVGDQDTYKRIAGQINATYQVNDWLKIGTNTSIERAEIVSVSANNMTSTGSVIGGAYFFDPTVPVNYANDADAPAGLGQLEYEAGGGYIDRNQDGLLYGESILMQSNLWNPILMKDNYTNESWRSNINGSAYIELTPIEGLVYTSRLGYRFGTEMESNYTSAYYHNTSQSRARGGLSAEARHNFYYQWENFANYSFSVGSNDFTAMAGMQYVNDNNSFVSGNTALLGSDEPNYRYLDYSDAAATDGVGGNNIDRRSISYFGRLDWNYEGKYMLQGTFRADAFDASKLSTDNRWGYFPAFSAGWDISRESFIEDLNLGFLDQFKVRGSWGINGNVTVLRNYPYSPSLSLGDSYYSFTNQLVSAATPANQLPNPELVWEKSKQTDIGFDSRFFNSRLSLNVDYFIKTTDGLLATGPAPVVSGTSTVMRNAGEIENRGLEVDMGWKGQVGDFKYNIIANFSTVKNEVIESPYGEGRQFGGGGFISGFVQGGGTYFEKGYPIWYLRGRVLDHYDGDTGLPIWKTAEELGTDDGMDYLGSVIPDFSYGFTFSAEYKGVDLRVFGMGQQGSELSWAINRFDLPIMNYPTMLFEDRWTPSNPNATYASPQVYTTGGAIAAYGGSNVFVYDNSFFKIKEIQLGYSLPSALIERVKISQLRVYVSLENYFTSTNYPGIDPESMAGVTAGDDPNLAGGMGIDRIQYPSMKQATFGINVSF
ncbi:TonB-dependent receptor [uncultured Draconibacterium sp.]|uniref:TonB-dependent receptor n=1 Tax=uncultured Draconibacterium sp. TaxID=1573823 RepID=UPI002AA82207|nr:TonB-dependent receptor [uncultured Draconibacterium sp.]